ncbi:MAG: hypothetical protein KAK00_02000 [Nanoarchaeota archaeon]|nr:hypothetical protein [Nanoarchaeota archaeon]
MPYKVFRTTTFTKKYKKLPKEEQKIIDKFIKEVLAINPRGKPLDVHGIMEKKIKGRRIYYIVYDDYLIVLMVAISSKKDQQDTIDTLRKYLSEFLKLIEELSKK